MFRRKQDVDKHVSSILVRKRDEKEKNSQGYQIARLYADIKEYSIARRYLSGFLSVRENVPSAYQLMGEINEGLGQKEPAIDNYKRALDLGGFVSSNRHLVQKICELYTEIGTDVPRMKYWLEQLEKLDPKSDTIFKLKARIAGADNENGNNKNGEMENILSAELVKHPTDLKLRTKLLQLYLDSDRCDEAYEVAVTCDLTTAFASSLPWFECLQSVFKQHGEKNQETKTDGAYNQHYLHVLRNLVYLSLPVKDVSECVEALSRFDRQLKYTVSMGASGEAWSAMLKEMKSQMFFLAALVLLKRAQTGAVSWQDVNHLSGACLLASKSFAPLDAQAPWILSAPTSHRKFYEWWHQQSFDRLSQVGHMLQQLSQKKRWEDVTEWSLSVRRDTMTSVGHQRVFELLYSPRDIRAQGAASFLFQAQEMVAAGGSRDREPFTEQHLLDVDRVAYQVHLGDLNHLVWLCLQRYSPDMAAQPNYLFTLMENIQFSVKNLEDTAAETLSQLDILVFLLATVRCAASAISENILRYADSSGRPSLLPVCLSKPLCSPEQQEWWAAVFSFCTNSIKEDFSRLRRVLVRGLETVRLAGSHGISVQMMAHLARSLDAKVKSYRSGQHGCRCSAYELNQLESRAAFYWERSKLALQKAQRNQHTPMPKKRLFKEAGDSDTSPAVVKFCFDEATFALALHAMKADRLEDAIKGFEKLRTPWAKFYSAKIYKQLSDQEAERDGESEESVVKRKALADKARDCLYDTIDRLEGDKSHELNVLIYRELDELEVTLHGLELDERNASPNHSFHTPVKSPSEIRGNRTLEASLSGAMVHSTPRQTSSGTSHVTNGSTSNRSIAEPDVGAPDEHDVSSSSDRRELAQVRPRPSPERLDAQLKSVSYSQSSMFKMVLDRNDELIMINSKLMEELRDNNNQLKSVLTENQGLMTDLKSFLTDNRDMMRQIKNELSGLKAGLAQQTAAPPPPQPPIQPTPPLYLPPHMAATGVPPPRGPSYPSFPPPAYPPGPAGYMINSPMAPPPPRPSAMGPQYRPSGLPGAQSSNVGKYRSPSDQEEEEECVDPDDLTSAEEAAALYAEYCDEAGGYSQYFTPDSQMMQDWTARSAMDAQPPPMTMPPAAQMPPRMSMPSPGYFASALRGQSLQYAQSTPPPTQVRPPPLGPGFFSSPLTTSTAVPASGSNTPSLLAALTGQAGGQSPTGGGGVAGQAPEGRKIEASASPTSTSINLGPTLSGLKSLFQSKGVLEPSKAKGDITILVDTNSRRATILMMGETKDIIFHHDIQGLTLEQAVSSQGGNLGSTVTWTATKIGSSAEREKVSLTLESPGIATQLKEAIQRATLLIQPKSIAQGVLATPKVFGSPGAASTPMLTTTTSLTSTTSAVAAAAASSSVFSLATTATATTSANGSSAAKPSFGGFTFSQTPVISPVTAPEKVKQEASVPVSTKAEAPKPFANFSLTPSTPAPSFTLSGSASQKSPIASKSAQSGSAVPRSPGGGDEEHVEEYEPNVDFKPVIELPELAEKTTGEENETALFVERCRLYRFDPDSKQWKERGVGELKILSSNDQVKFRIIMRRDQIFKLCANHCLSSDLKLTPMPSSDRAWCYTAQDFSEEEMKLEQLAAKFKDAEKASAFRDIFTQCCQKLKDAEDKSPAQQGKSPAQQAKSPIQPATSPAQPARSYAAVAANKKSEEKTPTSGNKDAASPVKETSASASSAISSTGPMFSFGASAKPVTQAPVPSATSANVPLSELFKPQAGSWECDGCMVRNQPDVVKCPACGTIKPGAQPTAASGTGAVGGQTFSFGAKPAAQAPAGGTGFSFGAKPASQGTGFIFGAPASSAPAPATGGFRFNLPATGAVTTTTTSTPGAAGGGFRFGAPASSASTAATDTVSASAPVAGGFVFKPSSVDTATVGVTGTSATTTTTVATTPGSGFSFKLPPASTSAAAPTSFGSGAGAVKSGLFSFATTPASTTSAATPSVTKPAGSSASGGLLAKLLTSDDTDQTEQPKQTPVAPKPSGGFNFSMVPKSSTSNIAAPTATSAMTTNTSNASQGFQFSFTKSPVKPAGSPAKPTVPGSPEVDEHGLYITKEGDDSHIHFEPIVALPDKIEVKTGEEDEEILFESRGKVYRFVSGEWKEKGLGVVKILEHKVTKKTRVLMRRDQILKICCNHFIDPSMNLQPMARSDGKAWVWNALDYSEEEAKMEQLALRFKTAELASQFKSVFDKCLESYRSSPAKTDGQGRGSVNTVKKELFQADSSTDAVAASASRIDDDEVVFLKEEKPTAEQVARARKFQLPDCFYLYESKPPCPGCLGCTDGEVVPGKTLAKSPKASKEPSMPAESPVASSGAPKFGSPSLATLPVFGGATAATSSKPLFGSPATNKSLFGSPAASTQPAFGSASATTTPSSSQPVFGAAAASNLPDFSKLTPDTSKSEGKNTSAGSSSSSFVFGAKASVDFSSLAASGSGGDFAWKKTDSSGPFSFAGAGQKLFGSAGGTGAEGDDGTVAPSEDIHFEPVIPLPDLVEVKTGEEDWKPLFCHRAKLYKYDQKLSQWKERGIGEMKIMQHITEVMFRVLQRREQVLKVACNHLITPDMELKAMSTSESAWCWTANDCTETEPSIEQFAVKLKTRELALEFKTIFEQCQETLRQNGGRVDGAPNSQQTRVTQQEEDEEDVDDEDDDDDDDDEDDDEEEEDEVIFEKRATLSLFENSAWKSLGLGTLVVTYNEDINGNMIRFSSDAGGEVLCSHVITRELFVTCNAKNRSCEWKPIDYATDEPVRRHFAASFSSTPAADEFRGVFEKGRQLAVESDLSENLPSEIEIPEVFSSGEPGH